MVVQAEMKRRSFRGVVDVIYGGEKPVLPEKADAKEEKSAVAMKGKRKADAMENGRGEKVKVEEEQPISKREMKRRAKRARLEAQEGTATDGQQTKASSEAAKDVTLPVLP